MDKKTVATYTLGCRVNQYETEAVQDLFKNAGYVIEKFDDVADVYIINTCTVTSFGDKKSRQIIRKAKKKNKDAIVVVMGCYAQANPDEISKIEGVDLIVGNNDKSKVVDYVERYKNGIVDRNLVKDIAQTCEFDNLMLSSKHDRTRAFVKIQDGCNQFCSYCIIPYVRGRIRSKEPKLVLDEIKKLAEIGYTEVVLTGIHTASYGKDLKDINLIDLVYEVYKIEGIKRIRFSSLEPNIIDQRFIDMLKNLSDKVCNHFHISLQSGCDETLKRMNRKYDTKKYMQAVNLLRDNIKDVLITTDVIVGFPQETDEEFNATLKFLEDIKFYKMHIFKYSKREGTKAATLSCQVPDEIKEKRSEVLLRLSEKNMLEYNEKYIGTNAKVLIETKLDNDYYDGLTSNYIRVLVESDSKLKKGEIYNIDLKRIEGSNIIGIIT